VAALERRSQARALERQKLHHLVEAMLGDVARDFIKCRSEFGIIAGACGGEHRFARGEERLARASLVHHLEMRRDARLDGKAPQQRLAKGVHGVDAHAARRIEHTSKEATRLSACGRVRHLAGERYEILGERTIGHGRPTAQPVVETIGHFGGRRLGEGQAKDARRRAAGQHERQHAVGQHLGLASASRRGDPDRTVDGGGVALQRARVCGAHSPSSPMTDHSLTRAR